MSNHWRTNYLKQTNLRENFKNFPGGTPRIRKTLLKLLFHYKLGALFFSRYSKRGESPKGPKMLNNFVAHRRLSQCPGQHVCRLWTHVGARLGSVPDFSGRDGLTV